MKGGLSVRSPEPISNDEVNVAVMLLHIAHAHPEVVREKRFIKCSELHFPWVIASKIANIPKTTAMVTLPPTDFSRIIRKLMNAELLCRLTPKLGRVLKKTSPMLPVVLMDDPTDPMVMFTEMPQCYFEEEEQDGRIVRQMKPKGEMLQFMLDHLNEE